MAAILKSMKELDMEAEVGNKDIEKALESCGVRYFTLAFSYSKKQDIFNPYDCMV